MKKNASKCIFLVEVMIFLNCSLRIISMCFLIAVSKKYFVLERYDLVICKFCTDFMFQKRSKNLSGCYF